MIYETGFTQLDKKETWLRSVRIRIEMSLQEDERMIELVRLFGTKRWAAIARCLPGRNGKQCRERWCNHLDPKVRRDAWTEAEDMLLFLAHTTYGNKWAEISKLLPGRSDNGIKNRWNTAVKKKARQMMIPVRPTPPILDAKQPESMPGQDNNVVQFENKENCEVGHGFRSYDKRIARQSTPYSRSAVDDRQIAGGSSR